MAFFDRTSFPAHRRIIYALVWAVAVIEMGLTSKRIHDTHHHWKNVAELLTAACLTVIWAPLAVFVHGRSFGSRISSLHLLHLESLNTFGLWTMWLVGSAIATHRWPNRDAVGPSLDGHILLGLVAFGLASFGLFTTIAISILMEYSAIYASTGSSQTSYNAARAPISEKGPNPNSAVA